MHAILINGNNRTITPVELPTEVHSFQLEIKRLLDTTEPVFQQSEDGTILYAVDVDCMLKEHTLAFQLTFLSSPFFGNALLLGRNPITGD